MPFPDKIELFDSGSGGLSTEENGLQRREVTLRWLVPNMVSYKAAEEKGLEIAPLDYAGHRRSRLDVRSLGNKWYEIGATYGSIIPESEDPNNDSGGDPTANTISFDTTGGTEHITQAMRFDDQSGRQPVAGSWTGIKGQLGHAGPGLGATVPELEGAINVEGDQVKGVDKVVPLFNFTETWVFKASDVMADFIATIYELTGTINQNDWRIFKGGEVLFMGARGEISSRSASVAVTFVFQARPNVDGFKVGNIEVNGKLGWDQMSVMYETSAGPATIIRKPQFVFINSIYEAKDFSRLRIGNQFPAVTLPGGGFA